MKSPITLSFYKSARLVSVVVLPKVIPYCPEIVMNVAEWFPRLNLKASFICDRKGLPVKEKDGTYTLMIKKGELKKRVSTALKKKFGFAVAPRKLRL
jgi:hypothetical protein